MTDISFTEMLVADVAAAMERFERSSSPSHMRDLVRTSFAAIEGTAWIFREHVIDAAESTYGLEPEEQAALRETSYQVSEKGKINAQLRFIPLLNSIRLIARIARRLAPESQIDFSEQGWDEVRRAVAIRNRITHPKSAMDLTLTETDAKVCVKAMFWFLNETTGVMQAMVKTRRDFLGEFQDVFAKLQAGDPATTALYEAICREDELD